MCRVNHLFFQDRYWRLPDLARRLSQNEAIEIQNREVPFNHLVHADHLAKWIVDASLLTKSGTNTVSPIAATPDLTVWEVVDRLRYGLGSASVVEAMQTTRRASTIDFGTWAPLGYEPETTSAVLERYLRALL